MTEVGIARSRVDGPLKATGGVHYAADFPLSGLMYAVQVTAPVGKGRITGIDTGPALAHPVLCACSRI
ncbi:hypothetical protein MOQ72_20925 [Saccharopolyspora sp. K220]|uniref:hypothetical protein n=1 Tax=Saccharopolyspora soli TaxID=2926618 RepID=UPI001F5926BC|nr:hypothetical protein [Saccharopolyspora soli]MCI2419914.1 hypothetical protein [Saccharopolyspora soli]